MMKKELKKKLKKIIDESGGAGAAAEIEKLAERVEEEFDKRVADGKSELDAYREILSNTDKIKKMLDGLKKTKVETEEERIAKAERAERERNYKRAKAILDSIEACMWILTVFVYILFSMRFGYWHLTWLIFLSSSIGSVLFEMVRKCTRGVPFDEVMHSDFSGVLWLAIVIVYFLFSFTVGGVAWAYSWLIFLLGAVIEVIRDGIWKFRKGGE